MCFSSTNPPSHHHLGFRKATKSTTSLFQFPPPQLFCPQRSFMCTFFYGCCTPLKLQTLQQNVHYFYGIRWDLNSLAMRRKGAISQKFTETKMLSFPLFLTMICCFHFAATLGLVHLTSPSLGRIQKVFTTTPKTMMTYSKPNTGRGLC